MSGRLSYVEIGAPNPQVASNFFRGLFGWTFNAMGDAGNGWFETPGLKAGLHKEAATPSINIYFNVPDLGAAIEQVKALGGHAEEPSPEEPGFGRFCNCKTPDGISFGLHQLEKG